jgi:hypothetical protein
LFNKYGIVVNHTPDGLHLSGSFFGDTNLLKQYAPKMNYILDTIKSAKAKVLIYHPNIHGTGVYCIRDMLKQNGYAEYDLSTGATKNVSDLTLCNWCYTQKGKHHEYDVSKQYNSDNHEFKPMKYAIATGPNKKQYISKQKVINSE